MNLYKYELKLLFTAVALLSLCLLNSLSSKIRARFHARETMMSIVNFENMENITTDTSESLHKFYSNIVDELKIWKLASGYKITKITFNSKAGQFNLLQQNDKPIPKVSIKGNVTLVIQIFNEFFGVYAESINDIVLNEDNIWQINTNIITFMEVDVVEVVLWSLNCFLIASVILFYRNWYTFALVTFGVFYTVFEFCSCFVMFKDHQFLEYFRLTACGCLVACLVLFYKIQVDSLKKHNQLHSMFLNVFLNVPNMLTSIALCIFNYNIVVHGILWLLWAPILQCIVLESFSKIIYKHNVKLDTLQFPNINFWIFKSMSGPQTMPTTAGPDEMQKDTNHQPIQDNVEMIRNEAANTTMRRYLQPWNILLMVIHVILVSIFLIIGFKKKRYEDIVQNIYTRMSTPFTVTEEPCFKLRDFTINGKSQYGFEIAKEKTSVVYDTFGYINSSIALKAWIEANFSIPKVIRALAIISSNSNVSQTAQLVTRENVKKLVTTSNFDIWCFFLYQISSHEITIAKVNFGKTILQIVHPHISIDFIDLNLDTVMIGFSITCFILTLFVCWINYKERVHLAKLCSCIVMTLLSISLCIDVAIAEPILVYKLKRLLASIRESNPSPKTMKSFAKISLMFMSCKRACDIISFLNIITMIFYVIACLPKYYNNLTSNGTLVRRPLKMNSNLLFPILYQYFILLIGVSLIGNKLFGIVIDPFKGIWYSVKYVVILNFNRMMLRQNSSVFDPIYIYNRLTVLVFYYIALTTFYAVCYYSSLPKKTFKSTMVIMDKLDDDFKVNIKASVDELVRFKVFVKALEEYRLMLASNPNLGQHDETKLFFSKFPSEYNTSLSILSPVNRIRLYSERVKRQILTIVFLRLKIDLYAFKQAELEKRLVEHASNVSTTLGYKKLLEQRLITTSNEALRFSRNRELAMPQNVNDALPKSATISNASDDLVLYDVDELEQLVLGQVTPLPSEPEEYQGSLKPFGNDSLQEKMPFKDSTTSDVEEIGQIQEDQVHVSRHEPLQVVDADSNSKIKALPSRESVSAPLQEVEVTRALLKKEHEDATRLEPPSDPTLEPEINGNKSQEREVPCAIPEYEKTKPDHSKIGIFTDPVLEASPRI
ncbi:uncharacterized protein BdWA1_003770 [Babesia duncani]|uniref:Uncharacterized protein n=1 Tax=Babesia duncani TaxID=323732 RepID=A0AAD9PHF4_9APIC|nr:hypothetical protein BdWA1_004048 [Babesia duncani]KAK2194758.1 hypothetical protein BdWA1_003770 [Babesia duncani]